MRISLKMSSFSVTRAIYFQLPVFSVALYYCPLPSLEVRYIDFVSNGSIAVDYLGVGTGLMLETTVATAVVLVMVMSVRNAVSTASGIVDFVMSSLSPVFAAELYGSFLFARTAIFHSS